MNNTQTVKAAYERSARAQERLASILEIAHYNTRQEPASNDRFDLLVAITNAHTKATMSAIDYRVKAERA